MTNGMQICRAIILFPLTLLVTNSNHPLIAKYLMTNDLKRILYTHSFRDDLSCEFKPIPNSFEQKN